MRHQHRVRELVPFGDIEGATNQKGEIPSTKNAPPEVYTAYSPYLSRLPPSNGCYVTVSTVIAYESVQEGYSLQLKSKILMDLSVHRLRFSDWQPSTIKTLASDPFSCKLAVGREDGDIEIRDSSHQWYVQATAPGQKGFNLQCLTWAAHASESGRLFGISLRGFIFEVSIASITQGTNKQTSDSIV